MTHGYVHTLCKIINKMLNSLGTCISIYGNLLIQYIRYHLFCIGGSQRVPDTDITKGLLIMSLHTFTYVRICAGVPCT